MKIVIAPDSFKGSLSAREACDAIAEGVRRVQPDAELDLIPMADGGEGTVDALVAATNGKFHATPVTGPLGEPVDARWGMMGEGTEGEPPTAVVEMAAASGLPLVGERRDPMRTTTYGTGELVRAALEAGARRIIVGIGGSATNDGGAGAAQAVGVRFVDGVGLTLEDGLAGGDLGAVATVDATVRDPRLEGCEIVVACDVDNPLCGPRGASAVYGPQKGANEETVAALDANLAHFADVFERDLACTVRDMPGAGAAGGLGAGLVAFFDGRLEPGIDIVLRALRVEERIAGADLVLTGEGQLDAQSDMGKVIFGLGRLAKSDGIPVIALVGSVGPGVEAVRDYVRAHFSIVNRPMDLASAQREAATLLADLTENVMRAAAG